MYNTVAQLREAVTNPLSEEYRSKMHQPVPNLPVINDRAAYLVDKAKGKRVLDIGCTGPISARMRLEASSYYGVDRRDDDGVIGVELDNDPGSLPVFDLDWVICSEVLEHLANPGNFLAALREKYPDTPAIFTVPNAAACKVRDGIECVNGDHVAWYSYSTLRVLLTRYGYTVKLARWYHGQPYTAEGLIFITG